MELHIFTAQMGKYRGDDALDVTVKSGDINFAPTWDMVSAWKEGKIDWAVYSKRYLQLMQQSYKRNRDAWHELLNKDVLTLLCYCRAGEHCHRYLLADLLCKLGEKTGVYVVNEGERPLPIKEEDNDQNVILEQLSLF
jgi:uncharacterized protein YeaO (DUF488 family)